MPFHKATIANMSAKVPADRLPVDVKFNPSEYSISRNMNYAEVQVPGLQTPLLQFVRGEAQSLSLELFLDASDRVNAPQNIDADLLRLRGFVTIQDDTHAPPVVEFKWGTQSFEGVVTNYTEKFVMFAPAGDVTRARVTLQLKQYLPVSTQLKDPKRESPDRTKTRVVREGERIDLIAAEEYGDPSQWPAIARANNLARPRILVAGTLLVIPTL